MTKAINISDGTTRVIAFGVGIVGVVTFIASAIYEAYFKAAPVDPTEAVVTNDTNGLIMLFAAYALVLMGIALYTSSMTGIDMRMKTINFSSFYLFCLFVPFAIIFILVTITTKVSASLGPILFLGWLIQGIWIGIWFVPKLRKIHELSEVEIMKLDYYSTIAILGLTIVWVIYDILSIKLGFAIIMGEFLAIQVWIKKYYIDKKEASH